MSPWRDALNQNPEYFDISRWPIIDIVEIPEKYRKKFLWNKRIVAKVLSGEPIKNIAESCQVSSATVIKLMNRCFCDVDGSYALTSALIPYRHLALSHRQSPLPAFNNAMGTPCALKGLFDQLPQLEQALDNYIKERVNDNPAACPISPSSFHGMFKQLLSDLHWPTNQYPYTTASMAYESLRQYLYKTVEDYRTNEVCQRCLDFSPKSALFKQGYLNRAIEIDSQTTDFQGRLELVLNDKLIPLRLARATLYCAIDVDTDCILGYHIVHDVQPNRWDVLQLAENCQAPWKHLNLTTPGLSYEPGAGFPSMLDIPTQITFDTIKFDNAWVHHSKSTELLFAEQYGSTLSLGRKRLPRTRNWVEHAFDLLNRQLSHKLPSTTGSSVTDLKRETAKNRKTPPLFTWLMFEEALDVVLANHNISPQTGRLGGASPLELFREIHLHHWHPHVPKILKRKVKPFELKVKVPIKSRSDCYSRHINFQKVRYSCSTLANLPTNTNEVQIYFDSRDLRTLKVFTLDGNYLGDIFAPDSWQKYRHSINTRRFVNKLVHDKTIGAKDPLAGTLLWLLEHKESPRNAQSLLRIYTEFSDNDAQLISIDTNSVKSYEKNTSPSQSVSSYKWSIERSYHV